MPAAIPPSRSNPYGQKESHQESCIIHSMYPFLSLSIYYSLRGPAVSTACDLTSHNAWIRRVRDARAYMVNMREVVVYGRGDREGRRGMLLLIGLRWRRELLRSISIVSLLVPVRALPIRLVRFH